jgi:hypothetical protein
MICRSSVVITVGLLGLFNATSTLAAPTFGILSNGHIDGRGGVEVLSETKNTGWLTNAPAVIDLAGSRSSSTGVSISTQMHVTSAYGSLAAWGDGSLTNAAYQGSLLSQTQGGGTGESPNAIFYDQLNVRSDVLAVGTPVTVKFSMLMQGDVFGSYNDGPSAGADVVGGLYVSATHPMLTVGLSEETTYDTFQSGAFHTKVGNTIKVEGRLWVRMNADANGSVPAGKVVTRTFNYDTRLLFGIDAAPDTYLVSDSGAHYVAAVPEADTYAMMLAGLGLLGFMARRRQQQA